MMIMPSERHPAEEVSDVTVSTVSNAGTLSVEQAWCSMPARAAL
jgi:hypothetical protein